MSGERYRLTWASSFNSSQNLTFVIKPLLYYLISYLGIQFFCFFLFSVLLGDLIIVALVKLLCQRQRPAHNKDDMFATVAIDHYAFPSGHATRAALLAYFFAEKVFSDAATKGLISLWAMFVCMSRVLLGRHHVFDVLFGILIGICEYKVLAFYWLPQQLCLDILEPFFGHFHL